MVFSQQNGNECLFVEIFWCKPKSIKNYEGFYLKTKHKKGAQ